MILTDATDPLSDPADLCPAAPHRDHEHRQRPRVTGRHRNRALAGARRAPVLELRAQGWAYDAIAEELGYTSRATVHHIVKAALAA